MANWKCEGCGGTCIIETDGESTQPEHCPWDGDIDVNWEEYKDE